MPLDPENKNKPFFSAMSLPISKHPGRERPPRDYTYGGEGRSRFLIGGHKFGFGFRRRIFNHHIEKQLDQGTRYDTKNIYIDCLERTPQPTDKKVKNYKHFKNFPDFYFYP